MNKIAVLSFGASRRMLVTGLALLGIVGLLLACAGPENTPEPGGGSTPTPTEEPAFDAEAHFQGRDVELIIPFSPGGGFDTTGRLLALHIGKYIPGNPDVIPQNLPGGGGQMGLETTLQADPDGLTVGIMHSSLAVRSLVGDDIGGLDLQSLTILGTPTGVETERMVCTKRSTATSWQEVVDSGVTLQDGATSRGEGSGSAASAWLEMLGAPMRLVYGYGGTSEIMAAFDRGELTANNRCTSTNVPRLYPEWVENQSIVPLFWHRSEPDQEFLDALDVDVPPHLFDLAGVEHTEEQRNILSAWLDMAVFVRGFVMPPGVEDEIVEVWVEALRQVTEDPDFIAGVEAAGLEVGLGTPEDMRRGYDMIRNLSPEGMEIFQELVGVE